MPKVPYSNNVIPMQRPEEGPSLTDFAMAAAMMHQEGRLFDPTPLGPEQKFEKPTRPDAPAYNRIWEGGDESRLQNSRGDILVGKKT